MKLSEIGEREIIDRIWKIVGRNEDYEDCVVVERGDYFLLISTDFIGEGTHFPRSTDFFKVGRFLSSINLSDIAAMGGIPQFFMTSMFFPGDFEMEELENLVRGMLSILREFNVEFRGGDLKESKIAGMSGVIVGKVERDKILRRKGAKVGDYISVTGELGKQASGYILWKNGHEEGVDILLDVYPRIKEGREIAGKATSCIDLSDGINSAIIQMEKINNLGFEIDFDSLPISKLAYEVSEDYNIPLEELALNFGGEYELFFTSQKRLIGTVIGEVSEKSKKIGGKGYEHFSKTLDKIGR